MSFLKIYTITLLSCSYIFFSVNSILEQQKKISLINSNIIDLHVLVVQLKEEQVALSLLNSTPKLFIKEEQLVTDSFLQNPMFLYGVIVVVSLITFYYLGFFSTTVDKCTNLSNTDAQVFYGSSSSSSFSDTVVTLSDTAEAALVGSSLTDSLFSDILVNSPSTDAVVSIDPSFSDTLGSPQNTDAQVFSGSSSSSSFSDILVNSPNIDAPALAGSSLTDTVVTLSDIAIASLTADIDFALYAKENTSGLIGLLDSLTETEGIVNFLLSTNQALVVESILPGSLGPSFIPVPSPPLDSSLLSELRAEDMELAFSVYKSFFS